MILVKASNESEAGVMPSQELLHTMGEYHEQLAKAGVLLDANGLQPTSKGWRIRYSGGARTVIDGPFTETKELIAGYVIVSAESLDNAGRWAEQYLRVVEAEEVEVRELEPET